MMEPLKSGSGLSMYIRIHGVTNYVSTRGPTTRDLQQCRLNSRVTIANTYFVRSLDFCLVSQHNLNQYIALWLCVPWQRQAKGSQIHPLFAPYPTILPAFSSDSLYWVAATTLNPDNPPSQVDMHVMPLACSTYKLQVLHHSQSCHQSNPLPFSDSALFFR